MKAKRVQCDNKTYSQTLKGHTEDCLKILKAYFTKKSNVLKSFCNKWEIDEESFKRNLFLAIAFHDIGKLTKEFQNNIDIGTSSKDYPHPFFALPILKELPFDKFDDLPLPIFAILGHHTQLYRTIYDSVGKVVTYQKDEILEFANSQINEIYRDLDFNNDFCMDNISLKNWQKMNLDNIKKNFIFTYSRKNDLENHYKIKSVFTYFFSILQLCDDYSSANFNKFINEKRQKETIFDSVLDNPEEYIYDLNYSPDEFQRILFSDNTPYQFQKTIAEDKEKYSFLFAPCGRGKTEAGLWWAYQIKKEYNCDRIIFALPTQVTCNAMYDRFVDEYNFTSKNVGLFHGKSFIALKYRQENKEKENTFYEEKPEEIDKKNYDLLKDETFKGNIFFKPITITTIDHLAYSLVHGFSQSDFATGNLQNSIIIFDEVHYYETYTLDVLLRLLFILRKMGIPHLLMTGTAPEFLLKALNKNKKIYTIFRDNEGLKFEPLIITKKGEDILGNEEVYEEIKKDYIDNKKIFVVLNQVEWTQNFYINLKKYFENKDIIPKIILYHSRFIYKDRVKKEKEIKELVKTSPCILIATQVIEISLNISSDVLYSQIAPPDAIGQRAGRLNRAGKYYKSDLYTYEMKLFNLDKYKPYSEEIIKSSWNNFKDGPISYQSIKETCDKVYNNVELKKDQYQRYRDFFERNILFGNRPKEIATGDEEGKALKIRDESFQTIDIIPQIFESELLQKTNLITEYKCKIPIYYILNDQSSSICHPNENNFNEKVLFCNYKYSYELGLQKSNYENMDDRIL